MRLRKSGRHFTFSCCCSAVVASTNDAFCPSLANLSPRSELDADVRCVLEIVIDGLSESAVADAMRAGIATVVARGAQAGVTRITAGNYGGKLGPFHFRLHALAPVGGES